MMMRFQFTLLSLFLATAALTSAQVPGEPPSNKPAVKPFGGPPGRPGEWAERRGMMPGMVRPPMRSEEFDKLPETDKERVREALDKVWGRPEVIAARDRAMHANEEMRDTIREALKKIDPEAAGILAKIEPKEHFDPRQLPPMPGPDSPEFPKALVLRLGMEMLAFAKPERKEETKKFHERLMQQPNLQAALHEVEEKRGEERIQAAQKLRHNYREAAMREFLLIRERRAKEEAAKLK